MSHSRFKARCLGQLSVRFLKHVQPFAQSKSKSKSKGSAKQVSKKVLEREAAVNASSALDDDSDDDLLYLAAANPQTRKVSVVAELAMLSLNNPFLIADCTGKTAGQT